MRKPNQRRRLPAPYRRANDGASSSRQGNPPTLSVDYRGTRSLRFRGTVGNTATSNVVFVNRACLLSMICTNSSGAVGSTGQTMVPVLEGVRIKRVTCWLPQDTTTTHSLVFEWGSSLGAPVRLVRTNIGSMGASFSTVPPPQSRASFWSSAAAGTTTLGENLFTISADPDVGNLAPAIPIMLDILFEFILGNDTSSTIATAFAASSNTLVKGMVYCPLDLFVSAGVTIGNMVLQPIGGPDSQIDSGGAATLYLSATRTN